MRTQIKNEYGTNLISRYDYGYDELGRRTSVSNRGQAFTESAFNRFGYDDRNQLTESTRYAGSDINDLSNPVQPEYRSYAYDPIGNRLNATGWDEGVAISETATYTANSLNQYQQITTNNEQQTTDTLVYDFDGNLTEISNGNATVRYRYNAENRLIVVEPEIPVDGNVKLEYTYDYIGRRVEKTVYTYESGTWSLTSDILFFYDGWNLVKEITTETGQTSSDKYYVWGLDLSQSHQGAGGIGGLIASVEGSLTQYFYYDGNGNVGQLVNVSDGFISAHYEYDPFGNNIFSNGPGTENNPYRFSTKYFDGEIELYYYGYRYYSPELGRWLTKDPLVEFGGINLYAFAFNNSINLIDYLGLACELKDVIVNSIKGAVAGYLKTLIVKKVITTTVKVAAAQVAPVAGQIAGVGMTAWEIISFGRTAYTVYVNSDKIREALQDFYDDPKIVEWIKCLTEEECKQLAIQLGEVIGSFVANRKEAKEGIHKVKDIIKKYISRGKAKYKNSPLSYEIGTIGDNYSPNKRPIVIGEDMPDRVIPAAEKYGADYYIPPDAPPDQWKINNKKWINEAMDEGRGIIDRGPAPGRKNYPEPTSDYYNMERNEIRNRDYKNYIQIHDD